MSSRDRGLCSLVETRSSPPEHRKWRRLHGLQLPLHPQQVLGWFLLLGLGAASFLLVVPSLKPPLWPALFALLAGLLVLHLAAHLVAVLVDPADPELRRLGTASSALPEFDRSKHAHVIENGRCHLCNIQTSGPRTKHCSVCNKCVARFDHHCKWLNHCIGGRNYAAFLVCVVTAVLASLLVLVLSAAVLVLYHTDQSSLAIWYYSPFDGSEYKPHSVNLFDLDDRLFLPIVVLVLVLSAVAAGLLTHLCLFHAYISFKGITTYEYIRNYRQASSEPKRSSSSVPPASASSEPVYTVQSDYRARSAAAPDPLRRGYCSQADRFSYRKKSASSREEDEEEERRGVEGRRRRACSQWRWRLFERPRRRRRRSRGFRSTATTTTTTTTTATGDSGDSFSTSVSSLGEKRCSLEKPPALGRFDGYPPVAAPGKTEPPRLVVRKSCPGCRYCRLLKADPTLKEQIEAYKRKAARRKLRRKESASWWAELCSRSRPEGAASTPTPPLRRNRIGPTAAVSASKSASNLRAVTYVPAREAKRSSSLSALPALPPPTRRHLHTVSLKELSEVLSAVQQPPRVGGGGGGVGGGGGGTGVVVGGGGGVGARRRHHHLARKSNLGPLSPTLSPIHESGLSNPSTPHLSSSAERGPRPPPGGARGGGWLPPPDSPLAAAAAPRRPQ